MNNSKDCPFCKRKNMKDICKCGAYRVDEDNYEQSMGEIYGL